MNAATELIQALNHTEQEISALTKLWQSLLPECPSAYQFRVWLRLHTFETVIYGIRETDRKYHGVGSMDLDFMVRFASKVMNCRKREIAAQSADEASPKVA
jgi:hypothetical protein